MQEDLNIEALGLGPLDVASAQQLMGLASCLIGLLPEQAQLDMPAQRLIASMQVRSDRLSRDTIFRAGSDAFGLRQVISCLCHDLLRFTLSKHGPQ